MITKRLLSLVLILVLVSFYRSQTKIFAYVKDTEGRFVEDADVELKGTPYSVTTDKIGYFQFMDLSAGLYTIVVTKPPFDTYYLDFIIKEGDRRKDLGSITLVLNTYYIDQGFIILDDAEQHEESNSQSTVGLLQSSRDIFSKISSYDLGFYWFRTRGLDSRSSDNMLNGTSMIHSDKGMVDFSSWGGLNDITRYPEISLNHSPSEYNFGGVGSTFYKNTRASEYRRGNYLVYSNTNRNYTNRISYRYSSGMGSNGWAFTSMFARRWAKEGIQEGTFYESPSIYLGLEKKINDSHAVTLNAIGSDYKRSTSSPNTQEVYDYMGIHYNAYWGWHDGEKRSERIRTGFMPIFQLNDYWKINENSQLWTGISYQFGKEKSSRLNNYKVENPSPIYYKNLPSYWANKGKLEQNQLENISIYRDIWKSKNPEYTQINWYNIYRRNLQNYDEVYGGRRALYYLENNVKDNRILNLSTHYLNNLTDRTKFILNFSYNNYYSERYAEVKDLLGADFALNKDPFSKDITGGNLNTLSSNVTKGKGEKIGYDYIYRRGAFQFNPSLRFSTKYIDAFFSTLVGYSTSSREGLFKHYIYNNSYGKSASKNFWNFGAKGQLTYKINGRMFLQYNGAYFSRSPYLDDIFVNFMYSNMISPEVRNVLINANDFSYIVASSNFKLRLTAYLINTYRDTEVQRFFADGISHALINSKIDDRALVTQILSNISRVNMGIEFGILANITSTISANALASIGQYTYSNDPDLHLSSGSWVVDSNPTGYLDFGKSHLKDYKQGGTPQQAFSVGIRYSSPEYWWINANCSYLRESYISPSPSIRSEGFVHNYITNSPYEGVTTDELKRVLRQVELPEAFFLNASVGKSWILGKYYFSISASVNNILDNEKYVSGGFEQARNMNYRNYVEDFDKDTPSFAPRYFYSQGRTYFINAQLKL